MHGYAGCCASQPSAELPITMNGRGLAARPPPTLPLQGEGGWNPVIISNVTTVHLPQSAPLTPRKGDGGNADPVPIAAPQGYGSMG